MLATSCFSTWVLIMEMNLVSKTSLSWVPMKCVISKVCMLHHWKVRSKHIKGTNVVGFGILSTILSSKAFLNTILASFDNLSSKHTLCHITRCSIMGSSFMVLHFICFNLALPTALWILEHESYAFTFGLRQKVNIKPDILQIQLFSQPVFPCHITVLNPGLFYTYPCAYTSVI